MFARGFTRQYDVNYLEDFEIWTGHVELWVRGIAGGEL